MINVMNPPASSSSGNHGDLSWGCEQQNWDHHQQHHNHPLAMSVGLESRQFQAGRMLEYDWGSPLLLSAGGGGGGGGGGQVMSEGEERKPHIIPASLTQNIGQYNGNGNVNVNVNGMLSSGFSHNFCQNPLGNLLSSSGTRNFGGVLDGIRSSSSLMYSGGGHGLSGYGASSYSDARAVLEEHRHQLLGMMNMEQKTVFHDIVKREEFCAGDFQARIGLNLGGRTYFSSEDNIVNRLYKRPRAISPGSQVPRCQAEGCKADLSTAKHYHRRHKVCELHSKAATVITGGLTQRFCQQCSRFHILSEFDEGKRSCRKRLADHNRRRRKPQANATATASNVETPTALKAVEDQETNSGSNNTGLQPEPISGTEAQALLTAISLSPSVPLVLQTTKGQQQYLQQTGPNLSLGGGGMALDYRRQTTEENYSGLEIAIPWLRPAGSNSEYTGSEKNSANGQVTAESGGSSSTVQVFSSIQNLLPLQSSTELGTSEWMVSGSLSGGSNSRNQHYGSSDLNLQTSLEGQQMLSLLEKDVRTNDTGNQSQNAVEYLSQHQQQQRGLNSKHSVGGHSEHGNQLSTGFSGMQPLRTLGGGQSMYQNIL